ncbi:MAG: hypothetical protein ACR2NP_03825, partial [Pirellulaceae bacterium]
PDARMHLNTLLSLTTDKDGRLVLAREVWDQHGLSKERRVEQKLERYKEQWDESKFIGPNFRSEIENGYYDSLTDVFDRLDAVFPMGGRGRSYPQSRAGGVRKAYRLYLYFDSAWISIVAKNAWRKISLVEGEADGWSVHIVDRAPNLNITIESASALALIRQSGDGMLVVLRDSATNIERQVSSWVEFAGLYPLEHAKLVEILESLGFVMPVTTEGMTAQACVKACLEMLVSDKADDLDQLLLWELDSSEPGEFEPAVEKLMAMASDVHYQLECLLSEALPGNYRERLAEIVRHARRNFQHDIRYFSLVRAHGWCDSPQYLIQFAADLEAADRDLVVQRLTDLTGKSHGNDLDAWQDWIDQLPAPEARMDDRLDAVPAVQARGTEPGPGPLPSEEEITALSHILSLQVDAEGRISLDRTSWFRHGPTLQQLVDEKMKEVAERLEHFDGPEERAAEIAAKHEESIRERLGDQLSPGQALESLCKTFSEKTDRRFSFSRSGADNEYRASMRAGTFEVWCRYSKHQFDLAIQEKVAPLRRLQVDDDRVNDFFRLVLDEDDVYLSIIQHPDECRVVFIDGFDVKHRIEPSFSAFAIAEPTFARRIVDWMEQNGIDPPPVMDCPRVRQWVLEQLANNPEVEERFRQIMDKLNSDKFALRQEARDELRTGHEELIPLIETALLGDLNPETRVSLQQLRDFAIVDRGIDRRFALFAASNGLTESPEYLNNILPYLDDAQRSTVLKKLMSITGADPGRDAEAWRQWLREQ